MREFIAEVTGQLERSVAWQRVLDDVRSDEPAAPDASAAEIVEPLRWLLERVGGGLSLTQAGYLPPAVVAEMMQTLGWSELYPWYRRGNREEHARPVRDVREAATRLGLLRLARGRLSVTKAGSTLVGDAERLWWHAATRMPVVRGDAERQAGVLVLLLVAAGRVVDSATIAEGLAALGWSDRRTREPIPPEDVIHLTRDTLALLAWLGLRSDSYSARDEPPSPAAVAFARAAVVGADVTTRVAGPEEAFELTVTLREVEPPVWRRLIVPSSLTLLQTHEVLQVAMGWEGSHLHQFDVAGTVFGELEDVDGPEGDPRTFTLADARRVTDTFEYEYDFGDGWSHEIRLGPPVTRDGPVVPHVVDGARACPPEDCGGPGGYDHLLAVLDDPTHAEYDDARAWLGRDLDPSAFDVTAVNGELARLDRRRLRR